MNVFAGFINKLHLLKDSSCYIISFVNVTNHNANSPGALKQL